MGGSKRTRTRQLPWPQALATCPPESAVSERALNGDVSNCTVKTGDPRVSHRTPRIAPLGVLSISRWRKGVCGEFGRPPRRSPVRKTKRRVGSETHPGGSFRTPNTRVQTLALSVLTGGIWFTIRVGSDAAPERHGQPVHDFYLGRWLDIRGEKAHDDV